MVEDDHRVEDVAATRDDSGVTMTAGQGKVGQQGGLRNDVHRGGGHCGHEGLGGMATAEGRGEVGEQGRSRMFTGSRTSHTPALIAAVPGVVAA